MAIKTVAASGGGDYTTFTAAIAGASGGDTIECIEAGTYVEPGALAISKILTFTNSSGGTVTINQALGTNNGQVSGGVTVTWTGDFVHEIRKPGSGGIEYNWLISGSGSDLVLDGVTLKSDYTTGKTQAIYQQAGNSHHLTNCTITGQYETVVRLATTCVDSVIDGLTITDSLEYVIYTTAAGDAVFDTFDMRRVVGVVSRAPILAGSVSVTTSGLMGACVFWGMNDYGSMVLGTGSISIEKCTFDGSKAWLLEARGDISTGATVRDCEFAGFSTCGVYVGLGPIANLIDYCGASNGCPALSNSAASLGTHNQTSDPLFTDYAGHDYTLLPTSPRIDAGSAVTVTVDPDGVTIPQGSAPDIGAYEHVDTAPAPLPTLESEESDLVLATNLSGTEAVPGLLAELIPADASGVLTDIRAILMMIIGIDRRVDDADLPADMRGQEWPDRRGWLADPDAGTCLWTFERRPLSDAVDEELRLKLTADLDVLKTLNLASKINVTVSHSGRKREIEIEVVRPDGISEKFAVSDLWNTMLA